MRFGPLLRKYVGCMIEFCLIFHVEKSILDNLGYLIFTRRLGPMVKIESTFI